MKSQTSLTLNLQIALLRDAEGAIKGYSSNRDILELTNRARHHGMSLFDKLLPDLDDLLLAGLSSRSIQAMPGWKQKKGWKHPEFLHGLWKRIFHPSGELVSNPCAESVIFIRQIARLSKKIFEVCDEQYVDGAIKAFVETDREVGRLSPTIPYPFATQVAHGLFGRLIGSLYEDTDLGFRHGPGAVAERLDSVSKYNFDSLSDRIVDEVGVDTFRYSYADAVDFVDCEIPARLVAVPKTATKPRLIAIEPTYNQFVQQAYQAKLKERMSRSSIWSYIDQAPNQELARLGSIEGSYSTIDLSEASDRVSWSYVKQMFSFNRNFIRTLSNTRSVYLDVPGSGTRVLHKYASMGSALTFPIQMMYFSTIIGVAIGKLLKNDSLAAIRKYMREHRIRVYGDDIIVPTPLTQILIGVLEEFGLKVNTLKSFSSGSFRESCGADWFNGIAVEPVYLRKQFPRSRRDVDSIMGLVSFRDQMYNKHLFSHTVKECDKMLLEFGAVEIPERYSLPQAVCFRSNRGVGIQWDPQLQTERVKALVPSYRRKAIAPDERSILFKSLYEGFNEDADHLTHHARPVSATLKYRWVNLRLT